MTAPPAPPARPASRSDFLRARHNVVSTVETLLRRSWMKRLFFDTPPVTPEIWDGYLRDFEQVFGFRLEPAWTQLQRLPLYSPVFHRGYRNPPVRSARWPGVYFAGNYRTFPSIASTGTALGSGLEAASALLGDIDLSTPVPERVRGFRLTAKPRG